MQKVYCVVLIALCTVSKNINAQNFTNMFLGTPEHVPTQKNILNDCFDQLSWKFDAGATVRSTPVADNKNIYVGNEKGEFFSIDQSTGKTNWKFNSGSPIHSSPAVHNGLVFFSDSRQILYALTISTGKIAWQISLGSNKYYDWKFDFFSSSPTISGNNIFIGSGDGNLYALNSSTGETIWKFTATAQIRSTPAVFYNKVFFGDLNGEFYAVDEKTGKQAWNYKTNGVNFVNDSFGFDRKGIVASPVIVGKKIIFGARDGFMYNLDVETGKANWIFDYQVTWVLSSVATDGKAVYAGTSDGKYVNAIDIQTGKEIWRTSTSLVWSSVLLIKDKLYAGGYDGYLYCIDKKTGIRANSVLSTAGRIQSSAILANNKIFVGCDDGFVYALQNGNSCNATGTSFIKYVFYDRDAPRLYYRNGTDILLRANLSNNGFIQVDSKSLELILQRDFPADSNVVIVLASNYLPAKLLKDGRNSLLRKFLNKGGRMVVTGLNPVVYEIDSATNQVNTNFSKLKEILDIDLKYNDSRAHAGIVYCEATKQGLAAGLPNWWMAPFPVTKKQVDIVLGENVNGDASAYVKKYNEKQNSGLVQIWIDSDFTPADINFVKKIAVANF
ncbi:MAG: PQQ-binding-like beta-propeller repeat protein [Ferruginibacter sp.]